MKNTIKSSKKDDLELFYIGQIDENFIFKNYKELLENSKNFLENLKSAFCFVLKLGDDEYFAARSLFNPAEIFCYFDGRKFSFNFSQDELLKSIKKELDLSALSEYLSFCRSHKSFFKNVFFCEAGSFLHYKNKQLKIEVFDDLKGLCANFLSKEEIEQKILNTLSFEIKQNLHKNPACLLSGGLDSSVLCALFQKTKKQKIAAFNLGFKDALHYDESAFARLSADFIGCDLQRVNITRNDFISEFESLFDYACEPLADSATLALKFLSKKIKEFGYECAFSAEGSDECFLGYDLYFRVLEFYKYDIPPAKYPQISKDSEYLRRKAKNLPIYGGFCEVFTAFQKELLFKNSPQFTLFEPIKKYENSYENFSQMRFMDLKIASNSTILKKLSMMDIELFTPFLSLAKFALKIPNPSPNNEPKELLKNLAKKQKLLPNEIIFRKKKGLSTPFLEWILKDCSASKEILKCNEILNFTLFDEDFVFKLEQKARRGRFKQHLWTLLVFSKWLQKHFG